MVDRIELPDVGRLEIRDGDAVAAELVFLPLEGPPRSLGAHPLLRREDGPLAFAVAESGDRILAGRRRAEALHWFDASHGRLRIVPTAERLRGSEELCIEAAGDLFVALTENGVLGVDAEGRERWRIARVSYGWRFVGRSGARVFLTDADGNLLAFDAESGEEID